MTPPMEYVFWGGGIVAAIIALATPFFRVAARVDKIERHLAELHTDMRWVKRELGHSRD